MADEFDKLWNSAPTSPSVPAAADVSADVDFDSLWNSAPQAPTTSAQIAVPRANILAGGLTDLLSGLTLGSGDEIVAGGAAGIDALFGGPGYEARLNQARGLEAQYEKNHPWSSILSNVSGAFYGPNALFAPFRTTKAVTTTGKVINATKAIGANAAQGVAEAGALGAAQAFGEGEGGAEKRFEGMLEALTDPVSLAVGAAGGAVAGGTKTAQKVSDEFLAQALNIQVSDLRKGAKFSKGGTEVSPLKAAIEAVRSKGIFKGAPDAAETVKRNTTEIEKLGTEIKDLLKSAKLTSGKEVVPVFSHAAKFIKDNPYDKESLMKQFANRENVIAEHWDGTVMGMQIAKQKLYRKAYQGTTDSKAFDQAIARDLKEAVERGAKDILDEDALIKLRSLNKEQGQHLAVSDILEKNLFESEKVNGFAKGLRRAVVSPLGGGALGVGTSLYTGDPRWAAAGLLGSAAASRTGQLVISDLVRKVPAFAAKIPGAFAKLNADPLTPAEAPLPPMGEFASPQPTPADLAFNALSEGVKPMSADSSIDANAPLAAVEQEIKADPYYAAVYEMESASGKMLTNKKSSAKGLFQLIDSTAKNLGVEDAMNPAQNFIGFKKLDEENLARFGKQISGNPLLRYAAHYMGAPLLSKYLAGKSLSKDDQAIVDEFEDKIAPRFNRVYRQKLINRVYRQKLNLLKT